MKQLALRARMPGPRWWLGASLAALAVTAVLTYITMVPPQYQVWLNGRHVAAGRELPPLEAALRAELERQLEREIALEAEEGRWAYRMTELGMRLAPEQLPAQLARARDTLPWWQQFPWSKPELRIVQEPTWDEAQLESALILVRATIEREAVPASLAIVDRQPVITPEVVGAKVHTASVLTALQQMGDSTHLQIPVERDVPDVTQASLEQLGIKRLIAEWSTEYDPTIPRAENVAKAALAFNGLMLKPGEILSYNDTVGPINAETGWAPAPVIVNGELVPGIGGGVCQVATTFYGAALRANLDIVERHPHQLAVGYIPASEDAAIAQGWEDLKLRNTTLGHLLIETEAENGRVTFRLYGDLPEGLSVKIESRVTGSVPFPTREMVDQSLAPGERVVKSQGNPGLTSEAYRLVYQDGELVKRELLSRDSYLPTTRLILVGPTPANGDGTNES